MTEIAAAEPRPGRRQRSLGRALRGEALPRILFVVAFLGTWQLVVPTLETELIPLPGEVGAFILNELRGDTLAPATVYEAFGITLARLGAGLGIAFPLGLAIGVAMGLSRRFEAFSHDLVIGGLTMPYLVWALIAALWFGFTFLTPVLVVALAAIPFVIMNVAEGVRAVSKDLVDMARSYGVPRSRVVRRLIIPSLMPFLFASLRYGLSLGWKALALAEVFGAADGAGWMLRFWYDAHRTTGLIGYAFFFIVFAIVVDQVVFRWLSNRVFRWRPEVARRGAAVQ